MAVHIARSFVDLEHPRLVFLVSITHGFNEFFSIIVPPLFPFLVPGLGLSYSAASLLVVVFFLTYSVFQLPVGPLADVYDDRVLLVAGMVVLAVGIATVAVASTFPLMLAGMFVAGVGGSTYHPTGMAIISDAETPDTHGRSMGVHGMLGSAGTVTAPLLVVAVAGAAGWRTALLVGAGVGVAFALLLYLAYPHIHPESETSVSLRAALHAVRTEATSEGASRRVRNAVLSTTVLKLFVLFVVVGAEVRAVQTFTASFAIAATGMGETYGGTMLAITMVTAGAASMLAGYGVDRVNRVWFSLACFLGTAVVVAALALASLPLFLFPVGFAVLGVALYSVYPAANAIAASASTESTSGSLFAVTNTAAAVGGAAGPYLLGTVADATSLSVGFLSTAGIAAVGMVVALWSRDLA